VSPVQAVTLGLVQGLTEFLPVSSSAHLVLVPVVLGWPDQGLGFDAAVHLGTALALFCYFARDLARLAAGAVARQPRELRLVLAVAVGSIPAALAGLLFESALAAHARSARVVALSLIGWALVLWWADRRAAGATVRQMEDTGVGRSLLIGSAQAIALVPGTSRSGITISAGLLAGLDRATAARFSFLLGLPITTGVGAVKTRALLAAGLAPGESLGLALALLAAFAAGLAAVSLLVGYLRQRSLAVFVVYRIVLGLLILALT
jgi:undecaprenyl-diphosphatase